jgi:hypothetical protein
MRQKSVNQKPSSERIVKDIRRATRTQYSAEVPIPMKTPRHSDLMAPWIPT